MNFFYFDKIKRTVRGFSFLEILIIIAVTMILASATVPIYGRFQSSSQLNEATVQIVQNLRLAREFSIDGLNDSAHGVYFEINSSSKDKCIIYQGDSYATRNSDYDRETVFDLVLTLSSTLTNNEINFSKGLGIPDNTGSVTITRTNRAKVIDINNIGAVEIR